MKHGYALVTGATSGIGREIARILHEKGYPLCLVGRREDRLAGLQEEFSEAKVRVCDLADEAEVLGLAREFSEMRMEVLVNCAGLGALGGSRSLAGKEREMLRVNAFAVQTLTSAFLNTQDSGYVLNVSSMAAFAPSPYFAVYAATKSFVYSYSRALAEELRAEKSGVSVTVLCPGPVVTEFDEIAGGKPRRGMNPAKCAAAAVRGMFKKKPVVVPGFFMKLLRFGVRFAPERLLVRTERRVQSRKRSAGRGSVKPPADRDERGPKS